MLSDAELWRAFTPSGVFMDATFANLRAVEAAVRAEQAIECNNDRFEAVEQDRQMILAGLADTREQLAAAEAVIAKVQRYAEEREAYGKRGRTVGSARIASDLLGILSQSSTDALQAHDRQVAAKALTDAALAVPDARVYAGLTRSDRKTLSRWLRARAVSLVPGNPEPTEGETRG